MRRVTETGWVLLGLLLWAGTAQANADYPNEPAGMQAAVNCDFTTSLCGGQLSLGNGTNVTISDATAPISPPWVHVNTLLSGASFGSGNTFFREFGTPVTEMFTGHSWKINVGYAGVTNFGNKLFFMKTNDIPAFIALYGVVGGDKKLRFNLQNAFGINNCHLAGVSPTTCVAGTTWLIPQTSNPVFTEGVWHKIEIYVKRSTSRTSQDGIIKIWLDNVLLGSWTTVNWGNAGFYQYFMSHTWTPPLVAPGPEDTTNYIDHVYLSTGAGTGGGPDLLSPTPPTGLTVQ
jgi:hypothetical protein